MSCEDEGSVLGEDLTEQNEVRRSVVRSNLMDRSSQDEIQGNVQTDYKAVADDRGKADGQHAAKEKNVTSHDQAEKTKSTNGVFGVTNET